MSKRKKLKNLTALKTTAQKLKNMGQGGDTELVHVNKYEEKVLERIRGGKLKINPKTGLKSAEPMTLAIIAGLKLAQGAVKAGSKAYKAKKAARASFDIGKKKIAAQRKQLALQKIIQPEQAQALANLRKGAQHGMIDTQAATSQAAQPMYQQGQAQQAEAMGQMTRQGLEGSVIAQETSRKVGAETRANIAEQARQIAFKNEQTKAQAKQKLQEAMFKRGDLLRKIAGKEKLLDVDRAILSRQLKEGMSQANITLAADTTDMALDMALDHYQGLETDVGTEVDTSVSTTTI